MTELQPTAHSFLGTITRWLAGTYNNSKTTVNERGKRTTSFPFVFYQITNPKEFVITLGDLIAENQLPVTLASTDDCFMLTET